MTDFSLKVGTLYNTIPVRMSDDSDIAGRARLTEAVEIVKKANITSKYGWNVGEVCDLRSSPKNFRNPNLLGLNVNGGSTIYVRLRNLKTKRLLSLSSILSTLVHELVHCSVGPHNEEFYKLESEILALLQVKQAKSKKWATGKGRRLGGRRNKEHEERIRARNREVLARAAERRQRK